MFYPVSHSPRFVEKSKFPFSWLTDAVIDESPESVYNDKQNGRTDTNIIRRVQMELYIAEKVAERRRVLELTQEELARRIGVSSQAISNWERKVGYPDVTMIPSLARALSISTDELLGVGRYTDKEIFEKFRDDMHSISDSSELRAHIFEYCRKYPDNFSIMEWVIWTVYRRFRDDTELTDLAKELGRRILVECTDTESRLTARKVLAFICGDAEAKEYIDTFDEHILIRPNIIGRRKWDNGEFSEAHDWFDLEMILIFQYIIGRASYCQDSPKKAVQWNKLLIDLLKTVGDGDVPEGWLGNYGITLMRLSAAMFACGDKDGGYKKLEDALEVYEKWYSLDKGKKLRTGRLSLFDNVKIARTDYNSAVCIGDDIYPYYGIWETDVTIPLTADSGWEWFDSVRKEEHFLTLVDKAIALEIKYGVRSE